jgi:hypothetical protein
MIGRGKDWQDPLAGNECIFVTSCRWCSYHSSDYRKERLVHSITVVPHVKIHINISTYISLLFIM